MRKESAFTRIELAIAVVVFAMLVILLLPSGPIFLDGAKGRATDDAAKLSSLGKILSIQLADSKGAFFESGARGQDSWPNVFWLRYTGKDWAPFRSPFDKPTSTRPKNTGTEPMPISYGINPNLFDTREGEWKAPPSMLIVAAPALTGVEDVITFKADAFSGTNVMLDVPRGNGRTVLKHGTHENRTKINVLFADGHVSSMEIQKYEDAKTDRGQQQWQPSYEPPTP